jgi:hypothetical protein
MKNLVRIADSNFDRLQARQGLTAKNGSQMDKIVASLQMGSKAGPDDAQVLAKAERRVEGLKMLKAQLTDATVQVSKLYVASKPKQLQRLTAALKAVTEIANSKPPVGVKKHLKAAINELTSLREGVFTGAATSKKALSLISCTDAITHVGTLLEAAQHAYDSKKVTAGPDDQLWTDNIAEVIHQTNEESKKLQSLKDKDWVISRVPVIAVAKASNKAATGYLSVEALKRAGLKAESLGGYPVLHNQLVIGINPRVFGLSEKERASGKSIPREDWFRVADEVRKLIQKQTKQKLSFVDEKAYGAAGGAWFWVMPEREIDMFASAFPGKAVKLMNWGLASSAK